MALLSIKKRKDFFKKLNLGEYNRENILKLQKRYFIDESEHDGRYGKNTDILLRHVYNVIAYSDNFKPEEFRCKCGKCNGYPDRMRAKTIMLAQEIRDYYKKPMLITSGLRCKAANNALAGSSNNSKHLKGGAIDYYIKGVTDTLDARKKAIKIIRNFENHRYTYGDGISTNGIVKAPYMGNAMHTNI